MDRATERSFEDAIERCVALDWWVAELAPTASENRIG
jgi:hypothetical protein